jgi:hypothetical protein
LLDLVSSEQLLITGMHLGEFGFARIEKTGENYRVIYQRLSREKFQSEPPEKISRSCSSRQSKKWR